MRAVCRRCCQHVVHSVCLLGRHLFILMFLLLRHLPGMLAGAQEEDPAGPAGDAVDHHLQRAPAHEAALPLQRGQHACGPARREGQRRRPVHLLGGLLPRALGPHHGRRHWLLCTGILQCLQPTALLLCMSSLSPNQWSDIDPAALPAIHRRPVEQCIPNPARPASL